MEGIRAKIKKAIKKMEKVETVLMEKKGEVRSIRRSFAGDSEEEGEDDDVKKEIVRFDIEWSLFVRKCEKTLHGGLKPVFWKRSILGPLPLPPKCIYSRY